MLQLLNTSHFLPFSFGAREEGARVAPRGAMDWAATKHGGILFLFKKTQNKHPDCASIPVAVVAS